MIRTKIICTIGPAVNTPERITALIEAGMNVARINFSHGSHEDHAQTLQLLKEVRQKLQVPLAIMLDTKGPEIRLGKVQGDQLLLPRGHRWQLFSEQRDGDIEGVSIDPPYILRDLKPGMRLLLDDGYIATHVVEVDEKRAVIEVENGGIIRSRKGVNIPGVVLSLPAVTERDIADLRFGCDHDIDIVAASFVRSAKHVIEVRKVLEEAGKKNILVLAKIENQEGVENFDGIIQVADGIMIARGDLGVEVPMSQVPRLQKMMIRKCYLSGKISVTATQMLESMIQNPRPTRAEASDVANAIYDSSSAVMLSGETAVGRYPIESVSMMRSIIEEAEKDFDYRAFFSLHGGLIFHDVPSAVTLASVKTAYSSGAKAIFAFTTSGASARLLARLRPSMTLLAMTPSEKSYHQLALSWGVVPVFHGPSRSLLEAFSDLSAYALEKHYVSYGDLVVVTAGSPFGVPGTINTMIVENIGDVLVRGHVGWGEAIYGNVSFVLDPESHTDYSVSGKIIVITQCNDRYLPFIQAARGVILQNHIDDLDSELYLMELCQELEKSVLMRADNAISTLKQGLMVTLDPAKALVYKGVVIHDQASP